MDLIARARELETEPPEDTSDGSVSWFQMNHEEAVLMASDGAIVYRTGSATDRDSVRFPREMFETARHGGLVMHSHPVWCAASFSLADLWACFSNPHRAGMVMVVLTSHPVDGRVERVRYIMDSRTMAHPVPPEALTRLTDVWEREERDMLAILPMMETDTTDEEMLAMHQHAVVERVCRQYGIIYRREIVR